MRALTVHPLLTGELIHLVVSSHCEGVESRNRGALNMGRESRARSLDCFVKYVNTRSQSVATSVKIYPYTMCTYDCLAFLNLWRLILYVGQSSCIQGHKRYDCPR